MDSFGQTIRWPRASREHIKKDFFISRFVDRDDAPLHATASEMFPVAFVLSLFAELVLKPVGLLPLHRRCLRLACNMIEVLRFGGQAARVTTRLRLTIHDHHQVFIKLYEKCAKPKLHYLFHVPDCFERHNVNLNCFSTERKHHTVKALANHTYRHIEEHVVARLLSDLRLDIVDGKVTEPEYLHSPSDASGLPSAELVGKKVDQLLVSKSAKLCSSDMHVGDLLCFKQGDTLVVGFAKLFVRVGCKCGPDLWNRGGVEQKLVAFDCIKQALPHTSADDGRTLVTMLPPSLNGLTLPDHHRLQLPHRRIDKHQHFDTMLIHHSFLRRHNTL